ncbi:MAG: hypothetical protein JWL64_789 [Frankiales bacterium]|nr:hypothetical protein [Frankiales bacterium]
MIGWYVHGHGLGHLHRLGCVAAQLHSPVTALSSLPRPVDWAGPWVHLPGDLPRGGDRDITAGGTLHWSPLHHPGLRARMAAIARWVSDERPALVVVDVSVEVAVLVRSLGVPVVVVAMRGDRVDRAHRTAYDLADALLAPWPADLPEDWPAGWLAKTWHVGAFSRADGRPRTPPPGRRRVALLWGRGGDAPAPAVLAAARAATPAWTWSSTSWVDDPWPRLQDADVVVTHAGQNAVAEVAAAARPAVVIAQPRPYDEQHATGRALHRAGLAVVREGWPEPADWPGLLSGAEALGGTGWARWSDGRGAARAAAHLDEAALCAQH